MFLFFAPLRSETLFKASGGEEEAPLVLDKVRPGGMRDGRIFGSDEVS